VGNRVFSRFWFWPQASVTFVNLRSPTLVADIDEVTPGTLPARFKAPEPEDVVQDTLMVLQTKDAFGSLGMVRTSSRPIGYWPAAVFVALMLATPLPLIRRLIGLIVGLLAVHAFIALRVSIMLLKMGFADPSKKYRIFNPSPFWQDLWRRLDEVFADNPTFAYVVPVFLWLLIVFLLSLFRRRTVAAKPYAEPPAA
jgi:hypothetical protein